MKVNIRLYSRWGNRIRAAVLLLGFCLVGVYASPPGWWGEKGVTTRDGPADFAAANQGQVKWLALKARDQFDAMLPGGAGTTIEALTYAFSTTDNYLAVNLGQLKAVAAPFYDRLWDLSATQPYFTNAFPSGMAGIYPWSSVTSDDADYAMANIGQVKYVFSFDLDDSDHDGLPDWWETLYGLNPTSGISSSLLARWKFDEASGSAVSNAVSTNYAGTIVNMDSANRVAGKLGSALSFDGTNEYVRVPQTPAVITGSQFTVSAWVWYDPPTWASQYQCVLSDLDNSLAGYWLGFDKDPEPDQLELFWGSSGGGTGWAGTSDLSLFTNQWVHIAGTCDGATKIFYLNGVEMARATTPVFAPAHLSDLFIGADLWGGYWRGMIDDVRIYGSSLASNQVASMYDALQDLDGDGLASYEEYQSRTDPLSDDTDGDGLLDGWELENGLDPNENGMIDPDQGANGDPDGDTLVNAVEFSEDTNPIDFDTDDDYVSDAPEVAAGGGALARTASANSVVNVIGAFRAIQADPSGATVDVIFDEPIDTASASTVANYSSDSVPIEPFRQPYVHYADLDSDGDMDLLIGTSAGNILSYRNVGTRDQPIFIGPPQSYSPAADAGFGIDVVVYDMDSDGRNDLVCGDLIGRLLFMRRLNPPGEWPPQYEMGQFVRYEGELDTEIVQVNVDIYGSDGGTASPFFHDINGDSLDDLIVGDPTTYGSPCGVGNIRVFLNLGQYYSGNNLPKYEDAGCLSSVDGLIWVDDTLWGATKPSFYDIDDDGDDDLFVSQSYGEIAYFENLGTRESGYNFPEFGPGVFLEDKHGSRLDFGRFAALQVTDYDNDGDGDLLVASEGLDLFVKGEITLVRNEGSAASPIYNDNYAKIPILNEPMPINVGWGCRPEFWDIDCDGKVDMLVGDDQGIVSLYINEDVGNNVDPKFVSRLDMFADGQVLDAGNRAAPAVVDFNLDGNIDGMVVGNTENLLFYTVDSVFDPRGIRQFVLGDVFFGPADGVLKDPTGDIRLASPVPVVVDLDRDGQQDIVVADNQSVPRVLWYRNADLSFSHFELEAPVAIKVGGIAIDFGSAPAFLDIDHDGDSDLFLGVGDNIYFFEKIAGEPSEFEAGRIVEAAGEPIAVQHPVPRGFDYNGDTFIDLVVGRAGGNGVLGISTAYLNDGQGEAWSLASPVTLNVEGAIPERAETLVGGRVLRLRFPVLEEIGSTIDLNDVFKDGERCSFSDIPVAEYGDLDGDLLPDWWEVNHGLDPLDDGSVSPDNGASGDPDGDGLSNADEQALGSDPLNDDTDGDELLDGWESANGLDLLDDGSVNPDNGASGDQDEDGLSNADEQALGTDPLTDDDADGDGLLNDWEISHELDEFDDGSVITDNGAAGDPDGDGLTNAEEQALGTDPQVYNSTEVLGPGQVEIQFKSIEASRTKHGFPGFLPEIYPNRVYTKKRPRYWYHMYTFYGPGSSGLTTVAADWTEEYVRRDCTWATAGTTNLYDRQRFGGDDSALVWTRFFASWTGTVARIYERSWMDAEFSFAFRTETDWSISECSIPSDIIAASDTYKGYTVDLDESTTMHCSRRLSDLYTTDELIADADADLASVNWPVLWNTGLDASCRASDTVEVRTVAYRDLSESEMSIDMGRLAYQFRIPSTVAGTVYTLEWIEEFDPEDPLEPTRIEAIHTERFVGDGWSAFVPPPVNLPLGRASGPDYVIDRPQEDGRQYVVVVRVDIAEDELFVCWTDTGASLSLTPDSYQAEYYTWTSIPAGIGEGETGRSVVFDPSGLTPARYVVRAEAGGLGMSDEATVHVIKVEVAEDEAVVCSDQDNAVLSVTGDSYSPDDGFLWSSEPPGIDGMGRSVSFDARELPPGNYLVTVESVDLPSCNDQVVVRIVEVDLDVDADYDGVISIDGPDDSIEESAGGLVCVGARDPIILRAVQPATGTEYVWLERSSAKVKVFDEPVYGEEIMFDGDDNLFYNLPKTLYVQGEDASAAPRDVQFVLTSYPGDCTDTVSFTILSVEFIDEVPDYSLDTNTDSDNFFLREYDASQDLDSEDLDIYYKILPEDVPVSDVKIKIYRGDTSTLEATLEGEKNASGDFKTGDNLHTNWTASVDLADDHPGFYRVQLEVYVDGQTEPICQTSIDDADTSTDGWQCPQDCLAIHDLTWKHRPVLHVHEDEIGSPSSIDEFMVESGDATGPRVKEWTGGGTPTVHPAGTVPTSVNAFWDLFFDDEVTGGDLSSYTPAEIAILTTDAGEETIYHSADTTDANNFTFLQFWMFENFSRRPFGIFGLPANPNVQHEGDMEHCQIAVRLSDPADSSTKAKWIIPFGATASQHYYAQTLKWDLNDGSAPANAHSQEHVEHINNRLAIYVALGAHATYLAEDADIEVPDTGAHLGTQQQYDGNPEGAYDISGPADETEYELMHIDDVLLGSFEGRWGYLLNGNPGSFSNGPPGPPHRAAHDASGADVMLRTRPQDLHNLSRKTSQMTEMNIP